MTGLPAGGIIVEVEFTAGVWTDVTAYVEQGSSIQIRKGRTTQYDKVQAGTLSLTLENDDARFTPKMAVLKDGTTANPYYPNVVPRKRIRVRHSAGTRFLGYIDGWPTVLTSDGRNKVALTATDQSRNMAGVNLGSLAQEELRLLAPLYAWPLDDPANATRAANLDSSNLYATTVVNKGGQFLAFGDSNSPGPDGITSAAFNTGLTSAQKNAKRGSRITVAAPFNTLTKPFTLVANIRSGDALNEVGIGTTAPIITFSDALGNDIGGLYQVGQTVMGVGANLIPVGQWRHVAVVYKTGDVYDLYVDGVLLQSNVTATAGLQGPLDINLTKLTALNIGGDGLNHWVGNIANVGILSGAISAANALNLYQAAATCYVGVDTTSARIARYLNYAGVTGAALAAGLETVGLHNPNGQPAFTAIGDIVETEGTPAIFYLAPDGTPTFRNRAHRANPTPALTVDAVNDAGDTLTLNLDLGLVVNDASATRQGGGDARATNQTSINTWGRIQNSPPTLNTSTDDATTDWVQAQITDLSVPRIRPGQLVVDAMTSSTAGIYTSLAALKLGDLVRAASLPATSPYTYVDGHVEGWTETISATDYLVTFDTSPRNLAAGITFDATGDTALLSADDGNLTLAAAITAAATTISVASIAGESLSLVAGDYPITVYIDDEALTITAAPASSVSPQSLTVTRAAAGTRAAPHAINAPVLFSPSAVLGY